MEIKHLISLLWRNLHYLILALVLGTALGFLAARIDTPVYESTTKILISRTRQQSNADMLPLSDEQLVAINLQLAKSQSVLGEVSAQLGSKVDPDNIQASSIPNTLIVQIKVQDTDPARAAAIANLLVNVLIEQNEQLMSGRYAAFEAAITVQLGQAQTQINELEAQIGQIKDTSVQEQLTQVNQEIEALKTQIVTLEKDIAAYPLVPSAFERAAQAEKQAQLDQLNSLMTIYQQIQTNLTYTGKPGQGGTSLEDPRLVTLQSTLDLYQQMYLNLLTSQETVQLVRSQSKQNVVQIVSAAPSKKPVRPVPILYTLLGSVLGLALASTFILVRDHFDDTLRTSMQVEDQLGVAVLGVVPDAGAGELNVAQDPFSAQADAFRSLGASLEMVGGELELRTLLVLNAGPRERKNSIAANLAAIHAQQGKLVILVDGDLKRPHLHRLLGLENHKGLADLLDGRCDLSAARRPLRDPSGLTLISGGTLHEEVSAWINPDRWARVLTELKHHADLVIVDGPSSAMADAQILASKTDAVLMVIHSGKTRLETAQITLRKFELIGARVVGAVLQQHTHVSIIQRHFLSLIKNKAGKKENAYEAHGETDEVPVSPI